MLWNWQLIQREVCGFKFLENSSTACQLHCRWSSVLRKYNGTRFTQQCLNVASTSVPNIPNVIATKFTQHCLNVGLLYIANDVVWHSYNVQIMLPEHCLNIRSHHYHNVHTTLSQHCNLVGSQCWAPLVQHCYKFRFVGMSKMFVAENTLFWNRINCWNIFDRGQRA